jgi:predicted ATPase
MNKIRVRNFGPIKEGYQENDGWMDIKKITVFIGNQGSGKSSVAKLISTLMWIEKALMRGDYSAKEFINHNRFRRIYCGYHNLENYFFDFDKNDVADIEYQGNAYSIKYQSGKLAIEKNVLSSDYLLPQIMYVPAERNFISTIKSPKLLKLSSDSLVEFLAEFDKAKNDIKSALKLPINNADIEYDKLNDIINVKGQDYKVRLTEASSGFQSIVPLYLVSWFLANSIKAQTENSKEQMSNDELDRFKRGVETIWADDSLTDEQKRAALSVLSSKFNKSSFINIVEEPEQNLFPTSQRHILNSLLEFGQMNTGNMLIITTHSPYIINYLTLAVKAYSVITKAGISSKKETLIAEIREIVPQVSTLNSDDLVIYELDDKGNIIKLDDYKGLPSDENYLNERLAESNDLFANLLDIEDRCL